MKIKCSFVFALTVVSLFSVTQSSAQNNPLDDLMDGKRTGLFAGGGVEYGYTRFSVGGERANRVEDEFTAITGLSGGLKWRLGYAISEHEAFYITSFGSGIAPALGVMLFAEENPGYYFNGVIGFTNQAGFVAQTLNDEVKSSVNTWNIGLGIGYEFRPHFMLEFMFEYSLLTVSADNLVYRDYAFNISRTELVASFNYLFY